MEAIRCPMSESHQFLMPDPVSNRLKCLICGLSVSGLEVANAVGHPGGIQALIKRRAGEFASEGHPSTQTK